MLELPSETDIETTVDRVWQVLADFNTFPRWNPFIRSVRGRLEVGSRLDFEIGPSGSRGMRFRPKATTSSRTASSAGWAESGCRGSSTENTSSNWRRWAR